jgi:hypothetical protein
MGKAARTRAESLSWERYLVNLGLIYQGLHEYALNRSPEALQGILGSGF